MRAGWLKKLLIKSPLGISLFYSLFSHKFSTEHIAVQKGIQRYHTSHSSVCLRRNIHRIEKGLTMKERRNTFALDYLEETVACYLEEADRAPSSSDVKWAYDVLEEYFSVVESTPVVEDCAVRVRAKGRPSGDDKKAPRVPANHGDPAVSFEELFKLAESRHSIRWFDGRTVSRDLVDKAVILAGQAPSACNRQPFEFRLIDDQDLLKKVAAIPMGIVGYEDNIPMLAVIVGKLDSFFDERDRHLIYIDGSLAAMSFVLALQSLGLSTCCINWPDIQGKDQEMSTALNLEVYERPVMLVAIGYRDEDALVPYSQKKNIDQLRRYNFE